MTPKQCITCERFTMKPRTGEGEAHLTASDRTHARVGMGRCLEETLVMRWISAESPACEKHEPVSKEQAAQRREWIKGRAPLQRDGHPSARDYRAENE